MSDEKKPVKVRLAGDSLIDELLNACDLAALQIETLALRAFADPRDVERWLSKNPAMKLIRKVTAKALKVRSGK